MTLRVRLKLKIRRVVQKLRRRKLTGKDTSTQNALQMNAGEVDAIEHAVEDPQPALHLPDSEGLGPCRLLDLPVELLLQILEHLWEPSPFYSSEPPHPLPSLRLLVHHHSILISHSPSNQDMQRIVPPRHSPYLPNCQPRRRACERFRL
jgi:hypothetical protein